MQTRSQPLRRRLSVAVIGPDGAGKTTICRRIPETLGLPVRHVYMGINPDASNHMLFTTRLLNRLKRLRGAAPEPPGPLDPERETRPPKNPLRRVARALKRSLTLADCLADEWYRQALVWYYQWRGNVVLLDRHFLFDFYTSDAARGKGRRPLSRRIHGFCLTRFYPRPDLVVLLDAPGEVLYARKGEWTPERLEKRRREFRRLEGLVDHFVVIDATLPEDEVLARVCEQIDTSSRLIEAYDLHRQRER